MNKKVLVFDGPKCFMTFPKFMYNKIKNLPPDDGLHVFTSNGLYDINYQRKLKYTNRGANEITSHCKNLGYDVTHYDFDARLIKKFSNISLYLDKLTNFFENEDVFDLNHINETTELFFSEFNMDKDYDYILCSVQRETFFEQYITEFQIRFNLSLLKYLKKQYPNIKIILGGSTCAYSRIGRINRHSLKTSYIYNLPTYRQDPFIKNIIIGSVTEERLKLIIEDESNIDHSSNQFVDVTYPTHKALPISNINDIKYSYKFIFNHYGFEVPDKSFENEYIQQTDTKFLLGCKGVCAFCNTTQKVTYMNDNEMENLLKSYIDLGYNAFFLMHDAINPVAEKFCNWIAKNNLKIHWSDDSRHSLNKSYFQMLFESGCRILSFGGETFDDDILKYIKKGFTRDQMIRSLSYSDEAGIWNLVNIISRMPYSKDNDMEITQDVILENEKIINKVLLRSFIISEGSQFHIWPKKFNLRVIKMKSYAGGLVYSEKNGRNFQQVIKESTKNLYPTRLINKNLMIEVPQHLLFALYDIFKTKDKVVEWMNNNYYKKMEGNQKYIMPIIQGD